MSHDQVFITALHTTGGSTKNKILQVENILVVYHGGNAMCILYLLLQCYIYAILKQSIVLEENLLNILIILIKIHND